jgi:hypothetical protein
MKNSLVIPWWTPEKILRGSVAFAVGAFLIHFGLRLLGMRVELFTGIGYFDFTWAISIFLLPAISGFVVSSIYGLGGKILAYFPPLPVLYLDYYTSLHSAHLPAGSEMMPLGWWGFFVILAIESSAIGGVVGEVSNKRIYGWSRDRSRSDTMEED